MSKLELVSFTICPYILAVRFALNELNIPYKLTLLDPQKATPDWFYQRSAQAQTPVLSINQSHINDCATILEFICDEFAQHLLSEDALIRAQQRLLIQQIMQLQTQLGHLYYANEEEVFDDAIGLLQPALKQLQQSFNQPQFQQANLAHYLFAAYSRDILLIEQVSQKFIFQQPELKALALKLAQKPAYKQAIDSDYPAQQKAFFIAAGGFLEDCVSSVSYN